MRIGLADGKALLGIVCVVSYFRILGGLYAIMDGFGCFFFFFFLCVLLTLVE
jgi:hypothetical protein